LSKGFATGGFWRKATVHVCPFLGAERTCRTGRLRSHFDPEPTSALVAALDVREEFRDSSVGFRRSVPIARLGGCFGIQDVLGLRCHTLLFGLARAICRHPASRFQPRPGRRDLVSLRREAAECAARQSYDAIYRFASGREGLSCHGHKAAASDRLARPWRLVRGAR
jgi:hypothetical protein